MIKKVLGTAVSLMTPHCRFDRALFILGHMRCGSTALSNVLCSHPAISGYGEAHIRYDSAAGLGVLAVNQRKRRAYRPGADYIFDKILHSRYDNDVPANFFKARAIFLIRRPEDAIPSIRNLFAKIGSGEYATDSIAADYYEERVAHLLNLWSKFPDRNKIGFSYEEMTRNPDFVIKRISERIEADPPLENRYTAPDSVRKRGAGDPISSHKYNRLMESSNLAGAKTASRPLELDASRKAALDGYYQDACYTFMQM